jgi:putative mRNA 3-end processing factor
MAPDVRDWLQPRPEGLYLPTADAWIDPSRPVARAIITHGHSDRKSVV